MNFLVHEALFLYEIKYIFIVSIMKNRLISILRQPFSFLAVFSVLKSTIDAIKFINDNNYM
ncbi:hypothetical protein CDIF28670_02845 [Clostridioides difficile]|nr:hypothetical protein CDIF28670_02845 [Clostridioides difficile]EGT4600043.1 hypothetical protein [Clostridioides difficile]SJT71006.1 Uncharacterised protein [Clostridioides difficile]HBF6276525.1 hypothetical protein [Clostridioides difficile]HBF6468430.1 hypothetical protein [Clostridioides difficile]